MSTKLRTHGKGVVVWILLGVLVLGLGGFGIRNFTGQMRSIGSVGDTDISINDYARALQARMRQLQQQIGKPITLEEATALGVPQQVQAQLMADAALSEQASRLGLSIGDAEVARQITAAPAFQGATGGFDREAYRMVLRQQGLTEPAFEAQVRADIARSIFRGIVVGGVKPNPAEVQTYTAYVTDRRPFAYAEITTADLAAQPAAPTDAQLQTYYTAHPEAFTAPEARQISYVWLTPEMLKDAAQPDDATLKQAYEAKIAEYQQPEHRMVDRLVFPSVDEAKAAKAKLDAGQATFADLAKARGLDLKDIDIGEVGKSELGAAGDAVFATTEPGVVGPVDSDLGPALFMVNGIIPAQTTSFDEAKPDLMAEATLDRARRMIADMTPGLEDKLASGATLEDLAKESKMQVGQIALTADTKDGIAAYQAFRDAAAKATASDFPEIVNLDDGGIFALRLDKVTPAAVIPFDQVKNKVAAAWTADELKRLKTERAQEIVAAVNNGATLPSQGLLVTNQPPSERGAYIEGLSPKILQTAFDTTTGKAGVADAGAQIFVVVPGQTVPADPKDPDVIRLGAQLEARLAQAMSGDIGTYYATALESELGSSLDTAAVNAVQSQMR